MRRTHRRSARSRRWTSLVVCFVLISSSLSLIISASSKSGSPQSGNGINNRNVKKVSPKPPQPGAPADMLPNLDEMRQRPREKPDAPRQIEYTMRSRRKPLELRHGRKVGDPLPPKKMAGAGAFGDGSERVSIDSAESRGKVGTATFDHARAARSLPTGAEHSLLALINLNRRLLNHAALSFIRYPALHSDENGTSILDVHTHGGRINLDLSPNETTFDLFLAPMPQSGSSKIVFASNREGSMQIYVMNGDGSGVARLTYSGANDDCPRWSPNGTRILFQSDRDHPDTGYMDIYVMNADGSGVSRLTTDPNDDSMASWSPDGSKIVFQSMRNGVSYQVYSMNADGSNQVCLTNTSSSDGEPSWSPDGSKIAFASDRDHAGYDTVYVMNANGSAQQRLTFSASTIDDTQPTWSPNGGKIAFISTRDSTTETWQETDDDGNYMTKSKVHINKEVYVMNSDGSAQTRLTNDLGNDDAPSWSPDGSKIVFRSDRERACCDPIAQVWTMNADGTSQTDLSNSSNGDYIASWASGVAYNNSELGSDYTGGNQTPVANAGGPYVTQSGQVVQLNGTGSFDPNGTITSYSWDFGDGTSSAGAVVNHQYSASGVYSVSLSVSDNNGISASSQGFVSVDSAALPVKINFDELPNNTTFTDQFQPYLNPYGVRFSTITSPLHTYQNCGVCSTTSPPNFVSTKPDDTQPVIVEFAQPVSNLTFYIVGINVFFDQFAVIDVYRNDSPYGSFAVFGNGTTTKEISFGALDNITKIVIRNITDPYGVGFDDFSFNVSADVKVTNPELPNNYPNPKGGTLTPNTQYNELVWADVVLNATAVPAAFAGGTYHWTFSGPSSISAGNQNGASVTLRSTDVGIITATVTYSKSGIVVSRTFTINSTLPRLTNVVTHQNTDRVTAPYTCGNTFEEIFWRYRIGCPLTLPQVGISFDAHIETDPFISDGSQSGIKFVQAVSTFRKKVARGVRCITRRATESDVRSGWQLDTEDPYGKEQNLWWDFSGILATSFHAETNDSPSAALTGYTDWDFTDSVYIDDQFEMYIVYYTGKADAPRRQQPLGKVRWNWGGLVVFDWNGSDAVHTIHSSNPVGPIFEYTNSMVPVNGNVEDIKLVDVQCPGGPGLTNNRIDSAREFVKFHYIDFLRRDPTPRPNDNPPYPGDPRGWNFWTSNTAQCIFDLNCIHVQRVETGLGFFYSAEFMQRATQVDPVLANGPGSPGFNAPLYNRAFVKWCYLTYLQRDPNITEEDRKGWDFWTNDLNSNGDYFHTIDSFQLCDDYRNGRTFQ